MEATGRMRRAQAAAFLCCLLLLATSLRPALGNECQDRCAAVGCSVLSPSTCHKICLIPCQDPMEVDSRGLSSGAAAPSNLAANPQLPGGGVPLPRKLKPANGESPRN